MMRDVGAPTGKDSVGDKLAMPAPMQVKNFGMRSQVKWTHLAAEDTSGFSKHPSGPRSGPAGSGAAASGAGSSGAGAEQLKPLWSEDAKITQRVQSKQAGHKGANDFDRPSKRKKPIAPLTKTYY